MRYIDTHAHLGPWFDEITTFTAEGFVALQERAGIERTVVTSGSALFTELTYGNEWTIQQAEKLDHLLVWLVLNPLKMRESLELLERFKDHPKVAGFKIHPVQHKYPADIKSSFRLFERLEPLGLPVLSHGENRIVRSASPVAAAGRGLSGFSGDYGAFRCGTARADI